MSGFRPWSRLREAFRRMPLPDVVFQFSSGFLCGVRVLPAERKLGAHVVLPLPPGVLRPSFDKPNILHPEVLENLIREGTRSLGIDTGEAAVFLPESSARVFVLPLESLPRSLKERDRIVRWRTAKLMPMLPEDVHLAYQRYPEASSGRVVVLAARRSVIDEYEEMTGRLKFRSGMVTLPSLSLVNLLKHDPEPDVLLIDIEEDALSLVAFIDREILLFRQKPYGTEGRSGESAGPDREAVLQEVENTLHFLEDREKRKVGAVRLRVGLFEEGRGLADALRERLSLPVVSADEWIPNAPAPADLLAAAAGLAV